MPCELQSKRCSFATPSGAFGKAYSVMLMPVFVQIVLSTLVISAEKGPSTTFSGWISDDFTFVPVLDARRKSLMVYGNLIKAMTYLATEAVESNYFNEVDIEVMKDGVTIGHGRLRNPRGVESG